MCYDLQDVQYYKVVAPTTSYISPLFWIPLLKTSNLWCPLSLIQNSLFIGQPARPPPLHLKKVTSFINFALYKI